MPKRMVLQQYFGYDDFRPGQEPLIDGILAGRDVLGIMPTGGGKSMCYQIPALLLPGLTLVVSPLISLMKDQVAALNGAGIPAALLNSSLDEASYRETCWQLRQGMHKLLYVAPERLENEGFLRLMQEQEISMIAVDEAHCVSQWGQDFRPSYLKIPDFVARLPHRPVVSAFTATATAEVQADIVIAPRTENGILVTLEGQKLGALIGHRGETLDAIQQLTNYSVNRGRAHRVRVHIDAENYRAKREESLRRLAKKVAMKVVKYRRNITLEPMNAYERHVIHETLQDTPDVITYSTGTEPNRRTVVAYSRGKHAY